MGTPEQLIPPKIDFAIAFWNHKAQNVVQIKLDEDCSLVEKCADEKLNNIITRQDKVWYSVNTIFNAALVQNDLNLAEYFELVYSFIYYRICRNPYNNFAKKYINLTMAEFNHYRRYLDQIVSLHDKLYPQPWIEINISDYWLNYKMPAKNSIERNEALNEELHTAYKNLYDSYNLIVEASYPNLMLSCPDNLRTFELMDNKEVEKNSGVSFLDESETGITPNQNAVDPSATTRTSNLDNGEILVKYDFDSIGQHYLVLDKDTDLTVINKLFSLLKQQQATSGRIVTPERFQQLLWVYQLSQQGLNKDTLNTRLYYPKNEIASDLKLIKQV